MNHRLGRSTLSCIGAEALMQTGRKRFPMSLGQLPVLLPGMESAVRRKLDHWLASRAISPRIVGEFDDGASIPSKMCPVIAPGSNYHGRALS